MFHILYCTVGIYTCSLDILWAAWNVYATDIFLNFILVSESRRTITVFKLVLLWRFLVNVVRHPAIQKIVVKSDNNTQHIHYYKVVLFSGTTYCTKEIRCYDPFCITRNLPWWLLLPFLYLPYLSSCFLHTCCFSCLHLSCATESSRLNAVLAFLYISSTLKEKTVHWCEHVKYYALVRFPNPKPQGCWRNSETLYNK